MEGSLPERTEFASLIVTGDPTPEEITNLLRVEPVEVWRAGEVHPVTRMPFEKTYWRQRSAPENSRPIIEHVMPILENLKRLHESTEDYLRYMFTRLEFSLICVGYYPVDSKQQMRFNLRELPQFQALPLAITNETKWGGSPPAGI